MGDGVLERWRSALLPLMVSMLVAGAVAFAAVSVVEFRSLDRQLSGGAQTTTLPGRGTAETSSEDFRYDTAVALEQRVIERRYELAVGLLRARLWTRMMGFSAGMVLALVGAAFVLGRLREPASQFSASGGGGAVSLNSTSPGLLLALLGSILMVVSIVVSPQVTTADGAVYLPPLAGEGSVREDRSTDRAATPVIPPPPKPWPQGESR